MIKTSEQRESPVTVFRGGETGLIALARSVLDAAGIRYYVRGDMIQDFFRLGRIGPCGYNFIVGPVRIMVAAEDAGFAREVLADLSPISSAPVLPVLRYIAILSLASSVYGIVLAIMDTLR